MEKKFQEKGERKKGKKLKKKSIGIKRKK